MNAVLSIAKNLLAAVLLAFAATACVHEFPDEQTPAEFVLNMKMNIDIDVNMDMNVNADIKSGTRSLSSQTHDIRYMIRMFRFVNGEMSTEPAYEHIFTLDDITAHEFQEKLEVAEGHYRIYVWCDYVEQGSCDDNHYITGTFPRISLNLPEDGTYEGSSESRDAYVGWTDIDIVRYGSDIQPVEATIDIHRPLAKFVVISDDLEEFVTKIAQQRTAERKEFADTKTVDISEFDVRFWFQGDESTVYNAPVTFDVFTDKPSATAPGLNFTSKMTETLNDETGMREALLGFDYIFVNGSETHTRIMVGVFDKEGNQLARTPSMKIPLMRNQATYVRGSFLMQNVEGGVGVNPDFAGPDFNYEIK